MLLLYDCCYPLSTRRGQQHPTRAVVECLFAGGFESKAPAAGPFSFTCALTDILSAAAGENQAISIPELHRRLIEYIQSSLKQAIFYSNDKLRKNRAGDPLVTKDVKVTPVHIFMSEDETPRSILLIPMRYQNLTTTSRSNTQLWPRVLLSFRLREDENSAEDIQDWILRAPKGVEFVHLSHSFSLLLLAQLSIEVWDLLPSCAAMSFVGFVRAPDDTGALRRPSVPSKAINSSKSTTASGDLLVPVSDQLEAREDAAPRSRTSLNLKQTPGPERCISADKEDNVPKSAVDLATEEAGSPWEGPFWHDEYQQWFFQQQVENGWLRVLIVFLRILN